ncbi:hypothetical protein [Staphylococcus chromogenes]|uniref:hypothetical protein n=1 Tax=Staphylococcus chromogenes TaxID=46126 RepID=UPI003D7AE7D5
MEFIGFADTKAFTEVSGISRNDLEKHVYSNREFQESCMYRFGKGNKRYIEVEPALRFIRENILKKETELW